MAFAAQDRAFLFCQMAPFTVHMKGLHQSRLPLFGFQCVTIGAALILGGFILDPLAAFVINVMAFIAFFDPGGIVVGFMIENRRRTLSLAEAAVLDDGHVLL